jgi:rhodanese-related sulfurtransferase
MDAPLEIDVTEAARLVNTPGVAVLLDIREPHEYTLCQIAGSLHIPMRQIPARLAELPADRQILVLCHMGVRSMRVTQFLRANGFGQASNIAGGIDAWAESVAPGMPRY